MIEINTNWINDCKSTLEELVYLYGEDQCINDVNKKKKPVTLSSLHASLLNLTLNNKLHIPNPNSKNVLLSNLTEKPTDQHPLKYDTTAQPFDCRISMLIRQEGISIESIDLICGARYMEVFSGSEIETPGEYLSTVSGEVLNEDEVSYDSCLDMKSSCQFNMLQYSFDDTIFGCVLQLKKLVIRHTLTIHSIHITLCNSKPHSYPSLSIPNGMISYFSQMMLKKPLQVNKTSSNNTADTINNMNNNDSIISRNHPSPISLHNETNKKIIGGNQNRPIELPFDKLINNFCDHVPYDRAVFNGADYGKNVDCETCQQEKGAGSGNFFTAMLVKTVKQELVEMEDRILLRMQKLLEASEQRILDRIASLDAMVKLKIDSFEKRLD